jgi:hypothetical protein
VLLCTGFPAWREVKLTKEKKGFFPHLVDSPGKFKYDDTLVILDGIADIITIETGISLLCISKKKTVFLYGATLES